MLRTWGVGPESREPGSRRLVGTEIDWADAGFCRGRAGDRENASLAHGALLMSGGNTAQADVRRRLLNEMGIEVWYLRARAPAAGVPDSALPPAVVADSAAEPLVPAPHSDPVHRRHMDPRSVKAASCQSDTDTKADLAAPERRAEARFAVEALAVPGVLLVAGASSRRGETLLAKDVVRAARRDWSAAVRRARFDWPQPGAAGASGPALAAFVDKQAEDCGAKILLITACAASHLADCPFDFVAVPDIASLAEAQNKLVLWRRLQELRL